MLPQTEPASRFGYYETVSGNLPLGPHSVYALTYNRRIHGLRLVLAYKLRYGRHLAGRLRRRRDPHFDRLRLPPWITSHLNGSSSPPGLTANLRGHHCSPTTSEFVVPPQHLVFHCKERSHLLRILDTHPPASFALTVATSKGVSPTHIDAIT